MNKVAMLLTGNRWNYTNDIIKNKTMKVLQINVTCGKGSTGVIAVEIADLLRSQGHESCVAYGSVSSDYPYKYRIGSDNENRFHAFWNTRILGEEGTGTKEGTRKFIQWIEEYNPDIIQIHNLHSNYLNYEMFFSFLAKTQIPVVWSFFDCWPFTGKCTHFTEAGCRKWETECCNCPQLHNSGAITWFFDKTRKMFNQKKDWFTKLNLNIIVCSKWLESEVKKSFLKNFPITMIYNWIDMNKFKEIHDDSIYDKYGIDRTKDILVSVSAFWDDKGTRFADACRLATVLPDNYQLVIIGKKATKKPLVGNMVHINYVNGVEELSKLYSAAIAFAGFSVEDTFGKVFAESMLCGTPAVVFNATACPEVVGDAGFAVEPHNVSQMAEKIEIIRQNGRSFYAQKCKDRVIANYKYEDNVNRYIQLYEKILSKK